MNLYTLPVLLAVVALAVAAPNHGKQGKSKPLRTTTVASDEPLPTSQIDFDCPSPDGSFGIDSHLCSAVYYSCNDNVASIANCDEPMIWDDSRKICALPKNIPDCSFDCAGKADSSFSDGCSQYYWWCWQERATKQACPDDMVFDGELGQCDFRENVAECGGQRTTIQADEPSTMQPVNFDCKSLEDGDYAFKNGELCQSKYVSCSGGVAWEMSCPDGLLFDPELLMCERIEAIVACGGSAPQADSSSSYESKSTVAPKRRLHKKTKAPKTTTVAADVPIEKSYGSYETTTLADVPETTTRSYGGYKSTTPLADVPKTTRRRHHKTTTKAPKTTTVAADVPLEENSYGSYETTTLADIPTTRKSYSQRKTTTLADIPETTTASYGSYQSTTPLADVPKTTRKSYSQRKTTTMADIPETTTASYGGYQSTTPLADVPKKTTHRRNHKTTTTTVAADMPLEENSYGNYETTTLADETIATTRRAYGQRKTTTLADVPTTRGYSQRKTTPLADEPIEESNLGYSGDSYGQTIRLGDSTTRRHKMITTTVAADMPLEENSYGNYETTTFADIPTTRKSYGQRKMTTLADIPKDNGYGSFETPLADQPIRSTRRMHKTTTVAADVPLEENNYGSYETTTLADIPTRRSYGQRTTTLADIPTTRSYGQRKTTTFADIPTTRSYGGYSQRKTTTLADIPTTRSYGGYSQRKTTTLADIPTTRSYGGYSQRKTTTLADIPTTRSYGQRKTTTFADIPTTRSYGGYQTTTPLADVPEMTTRRRSTYTKVQQPLADKPQKLSQGY